jgi:hypothetical protein
MPLTGSWLFGRIVAPAEHAPAGDTTASRHEAVVSRSFDIRLPSLSGSLRVQDELPVIPIASRAGTLSAAIWRALLIMRTESFSCGGKRIRRRGENHKTSSLAICC